MTWDTNGFGSHAETAAPELSTRWYLAEGATHGTFDLYYLLQNPHPTATATVTITLPAAVGLRRSRCHTRAAAQPPDDQRRHRAGSERAPNQPANQRPLRATDVSAKITSDLPILVERAMYQTSGGRTFNAGHESMGVTSPSTNWFFAEGATGSYFDMYLLLANPPNDTDRHERRFRRGRPIDYLFPGGGVLTKENIIVPYATRRTLSVDFEDAQLADAAVSMRITSTVPIIAERAMWWPSPNWQEAHNSAGSVVTSPRWAVAEGEVGGTRNLVTYVLIANTSATDAFVKVSPFYEDGAIVAPKTFVGAGQQPLQRGHRQPSSKSRRAASSRCWSRRVGPQELVVERAMYSNSRGVVWAAGTNALGTPLFPDATFIITPGGIFPKKMVVDEGTRVKFINRDNVGPPDVIRPASVARICPPINDNGFLPPGQEGLTGNMILDPGLPRLRHPRSRRRSERVR